MKRIVKIMLDVEKEASELTDRGNEQAEILKNKAEKECNKLLEDIRLQAKDDAEKLKVKIQKETKNKKDALKKEYSLKTDILKERLDGLEDWVIKETKKKLFSFE